MNIPVTSSIPWGITQAKLDEAIRRIVEVASPRQIILFGSVGRGESGDDSDVDLLVVESCISNRYDELVRLNRCLSGLLLAVDILVVEEKELTEYRQVPGSVYRAAQIEGVVVYDAA